MRDHMLLRRLHLTWKNCAIGAEFGDEDCDWTRSLHHVHAHPRDDVEANLVMLCGDGVRGCHGRVTRNEPEALSMLHEVVTGRVDTLLYLDRKLGGWEAANEWITRFIPAR